MIGNTPMVRLNRIPKDENIKCEILCKCEFLGKQVFFMCAIYIYLIFDKKIIPINSYFIPNK